MVAIAPLNRQQHYLPDLAITHGEELAYLWGQRRAAVHSETLTLRDLLDLHERIDAHMQGLLVAGPELPALLGDWLASENRDEVFAIACALLRSDNPTQAALVTDTFLTASGDRLDGLRDALGAAPQTHTDTALRTALAGPDPARAAAAAAALASQHRLADNDPALPHLLLAEDPHIAELAWRTLALLDGNTATPPPYHAALQRPQPDLRTSVLATACWRGEAWVVQIVRQLAESSAPISLNYRAALGDGTWQAPWAALLAAEPAPRHYALLARAGHPAGIEPLLAALSDPNPAIAAAAGTAFTRITGINIEGERQTLPVGPDADDFEREFASSVWLPDIPRARQAWSQYHERWSGGQRWNRGHEISTALSSSAQSAIDLGARWDFGMRAALAGIRLIAPPPII